MNYALCFFKNTFQDSFSYSLMISHCLVNMFGIYVLRNCFGFTYSRLSFDIHAFFIRNTFIGNARLKLAKNEAKAKQHSQAEFVLFESYSYSLSTL